MICVANVTMNKKQCTIVWYVDDNKILHVSRDVVTDVINMLENKFGKMKVTRGDKHNFLGMALTFHKDRGIVENNMSGYISEAITDFGEELKAVTTPARSDLFNVDETAKRLPKPKQKLFHSIVMKLMYVALHSRCNIHSTVGFLSTRVISLTVQDWMKLRRLICYLYGTRYEISFLGAINLHTMYMSIDVLYATHDDCKSHTGGASTYSIGVVSSRSSKQKLNTTNTTECELVGISDCLPKVLSHQRFMEQ